jgi:signal transduction histidine kinase
MLAAMQLLADSVSVAYASDPLLLPVVLCRMVDLMLQHGVSGPAALGCAGWALLQTQTAGGTPDAITWSAFARELIDRFDDRKVAPKVELLVICAVESLTQPMASLAEPLQRAGGAARVAGDAEYTALCAMNHCSVSYLGGVELPEVIRRGQASLEICRELRQEHATNNLLLTLQAAECMSGAAPDPRVLTGSYINADALRARLERAGDKSGMALLLIHQAGLLVLFGDTAAAVVAVEEATSHLGDMAGSPHVPPFLFHAALAWVGQMRKTGRLSGRPWREARRLGKKLATLAEQGPVNFAHKARLIEAELADVQGDVARAQLLYEDAVGLARTSGLVQEEAICLEWAARAAERFGNRRLAGALRQDARSAWESWGASAPLSARGLEPAHGDLAIELSSSALPRLNSTAGQLEFASVLKAARAVSGEINLTELLRTLMQTILENAGATWGMLVLTTDSQLLVAARAEVRDSGSISVFVHDVRVPVAEERALADALVRDVARTRKAIIVHDGATDSRYFSGEGRPPRSVFCLPVRKGTNLVGVMYLENGLARNAFTEARSDVVGVLCSQAAVSIENASLYSDLRAAHDRLALVSRQLVEAQESERRAVARELHDETGQLLTALALHLDLAANEDAGGRRVATIRAARELVGDLIRRVRRISLDLRPVMLDDLGLLPALLWLIDRYTGHTSVRVDLVHAGLDRRFPAAVETAAFRIVQEGLTNVARHAGVGSAAVSVSAGSGNVSIEVTDRGGGFDPLSVPTGTTVGLSGMQERATLLGGRFEVESGPGGTTLVVELPFGESA